MKKKLPEQRFMGCEVTAKRTHQRQQGTGPRPPSHHPNPKAATLANDRSRLALFGKEMEPERVRAYLQVACAGLGFDIGEVWWTSNENGSSTLAAIEEPHDEESSQALVANGSAKKKYRFVQLYTSKSYESRKSELINPPEETGLRRSGSTENLQKHVLSPRLVEAISQTTQVVWANSKKREGLTGRSDIRLQTAVGMPVAIDGQGNMCVVVMFSPNNVQSTDEAMEYLQSISHSATSSSIPCLMPVFDPNKSHFRSLPHSNNQMVPYQSANALGDGVTTRFVSLEDIHPTGNNRRSSDGSDEPEVHTQHELATAPKDTFGIPMLPSFVEIDSNVTPEENIDVFDEASYGIWSTIMDTLRDDAPGASDFADFSTDDMMTSNGVKWDPSLQVILPDQSTITEARKERLEEFCSAFLGMSVFDLADVWVPAGNEGYPDCLRHVMSVVSTDTNERLNDFMAMSEHALIKFWTGAVGRAFSSGNPVWSANPKVFVDPARATAFDRANMQTVLAVPVFSGKQALPTCVVACYSFVKSGSVPFVLKFVQQALRLLWEGLDQVEPHESVNLDIWQGVGPADLGEMAADVEMQQHFFSKKRPRLFSDADRRGSFVGEDASTSLLASQMQNIRLPNGEMINVPLQLDDDFVGGNGGFVPEVDVETFQNHLTHAIRSVGQAQPFVDQHVSTNASGSKRAHVMGPIHVTGVMPLPMPRAFPSQVVSASTSPSPTNIATNVHAPQSVTMSLAQYTAAQQQVQQEFASKQQQMQNEYVSKSPQYAAASPAPPQMQMDMMPQYFQPATAEPKPAATYSQQKKCRIQGCDDPAASRRPYCEKHSGNRLCEHPGCAKCAQGCTRFCIAHGGGRRCTFPGCDKGARDKFFCAAHGGGKRCKHDGCTKSAVGGSNLCTAHGGGRRCAVDGCDKSAQSSTKFCVKHGGGKKCAQDGCEKVARGRTPYCAAHGGGVRCKLEGCNRVAIGKMQLCRAHGGASSRSRKKNGGSVQDGDSSVQSTSPIPGDMYQQDAMFGSPQGLSLDFHMASV